MLLSQQSPPGERVPATVVSHALPWRFAVKREDVPILTDRGIRKLTLQMLKVLPGWYNAPNRRANHGEQSVRPDSMVTAFVAEFARIQNGGRS